MIDELISELHELEKEIIFAKRAAKDHQDVVKAKTARINEIRADIQTAMEFSDKRAHYSDLADISMKALPPKVQIINESDIPDEFMVPQHPKPDMAAIKAQLKDGEVPGCLLSNGGETISIKWRE